MGTRSLTRVFDDDQQLINMYRQMDGYPKGHGKELFNFLDGLTLVNGFSLTDPGRVANGAGDLAAQLVAHFKHGVGGIYLEPVGAQECGQEYEYHIHVSGDSGTINMQAYAIDYAAYDSPPVLRSLYQGDVAGFGQLCNTAED